VRSAGQGRVAKRPPDFILLGGMKCGSTTVREVLGSSSSVTIPSTEVHFFNRDDPTTRGEAARGRQGQDWTSLAEEDNNRAYLSAFPPVGDAVTLGEDSTSYLTSPVVPGRLRLNLPQVKLVAVLREPVARCYSHYFHLVRTGRCSTSFESALSRHPELLQRGHYMDALDRYWRAFPGDRIKVVLFEELLDDPRVTIRAIAQFLGVAPPQLPGGELMWGNPGQFPARPRLRMVLNRVGHPLQRLRGLGEFRSSASLRTLGRVPHAYAQACGVLAGRCDAPPSISAGTRRWLEAYYANVNAGLAEALGADLDRAWYRAVAQEGGKTSTKGRP